MIKTVPQTSGRPTRAVDSNALNEFVLVSTKMELNNGYQKWDYDPVTDTFTSWNVGGGIQKLGENEIPVRHSINVLGNTDYQWLIS